MLGRDNVVAKFDRSSFSRSGDMVGDHQNVNGLRDLATPDSPRSLVFWCQKYRRNSNGVTPKEGNK